MSFSLTNDIWFPFAIRQVYTVQFLLSYELICDFFPHQEKSRGLYQVRGVYKMIQVAHELPIIFKHVKKVQELSA